MSEFQSTNTCFVIGPIGDRLAPIGTDDRRRHEEAEELWEYVVEPACAENGLIPIRADKISHPGEITEQVFQLLRDAEVVIADLTGGNPNVMYELGLRHTKDRITIQLGENERLPFDINTIRTIRFRRTSVGLTEARNELINAIRAALDGKGSRPTATRIWADATIAGSVAIAAARAAEEVISQDDSGDDDDDDDEPGAMDVLAAGEAALAELTPTIVELTGAVVQMGNIAAEITAEVAASDARGAGFAGRLALATQFAEMMASPTATLEEAASNYVELLSKVDPAVSRLIATAEIDETEREALHDYLINTVVLARVTGESMTSGTRLAQTYKQISTISKAVKPIAKRVERSLQRIISASEVMVDWRKRVEALPTWGEDAVTRVEQELAELADDETES